MKKITFEQNKMLGTLGQRATFGLIVNEIAQKNKNLMIITGDVSTSAGLDRFKTNFPEKFVDVGIAEQNLIGVATGMCSEGFNVFTTTFSPFQTLRCCEQIKINLGYMNYNVKMVGLASGIILGTLGYTHCSIEDIGVLRSIPNLTIISPADPYELVKLTRELINFDKPCYIRLTGGAATETIYQNDYEFKIGKFVNLFEGEEIMVISNGAIISEVIKAKKKLEKKGYFPNIINMHTIKPIDKDLMKKLKKIKKIITVEEHNIIGGLGSAICEFLQENKIQIPVERIGIKDKYSKSGSYEYLKKLFKIDSSSIEKTLIKNYEKL